MGDTCLHRDRACLSWQECAHRTARYSAERARDLMAYGAELARVRAELVVIEEIADNLDSEEVGVGHIHMRARRALANMPMNIVLAPDGDGAQEKGEPR